MQAWNFTWLIALSSIAGMQAIINLKTCFVNILHALLVVANVIKSLRMGLGLFLLESLQTHSALDIPLVLFVLFTGVANVIGGCLAFVAELMGALATLNHVQVQVYCRIFSHCSATPIFQRIVHFSSVVLLILHT